MVLEENRKDKMVRGSNLYGEYLMKEALAEVGDIKIRGRVINKDRFADDTAIILGCSC